jgi:hypothetical protein
MEELELSRDIASSMSQHTHQLVKCKSDTGDKKSRALNGGHSMDVYCRVCSLS